MPTGAGKSLCYHLPAIVSDFSSIVVSPLLALMDDQVDGLEALGLSVSSIQSGKDRETNIVDWKKFASGHAKIMYLSPERLMQERMIKALQ